MDIELKASEVKILEYLAQNTGCDIYNYGDALDGRSLEKSGLVEIVKAQKPPKSAIAKQPYYGIMISAAGRNGWRQADYFAVASATLGSPNRSKRND